jgi:uncharacterized protein YlxW (UPF0749 family)
MLDLSILYDRTNMTDQPDVTDSVWLPKNLAAVILDVSERTLDRQVAAGKMQRRISWDGSILLLVPTETLPLTSLPYLVGHERGRQQADQELHEELSRLRAARETLQAKIAMVNQAMEEVAQSVR